MAEFNGNSQYLTINARNVGTIYRSFEMKLAVGDEDTSAGSGIAWEKHSSKLKNITAKAIVIYDSVTAPTDISTMIGSNSEVVPVVSGPQGSTTGLPKHDQDFLITGVSGPATNHDKTLVTFEIEFISTGVPRSNFYNGDTF